MNRASVPGLDALLNRPCVASLPPELRQALLQRWEQPDADRHTPASWSVLADSLDALSLLSADESALLATLLFDLPWLRAGVDALPLDTLRPAVLGLLDGLDAADQVWALHAGREADRKSVV